MLQVSLEGVWTELLVGWVSYKHHYVKWLVMFRIYLLYFNDSRSYLEITSVIYFCCVIWRSVMQNKLKIRPLKNF